MLRELEGHVTSKEASCAASSIAISSMFWQNSDIQAVPSACSRWPARGSGALRSKTPMFCQARKPPSKRFLPKRSLRFTHQLKFSVILEKRALEEFRSARRAALARPVQEDRGHACTEG